MSRFQKIANSINKVFHFFDQEYHAPTYRGEGEEKRMIVESSSGDRTGLSFKGRCLKGDGVIKLDVSRFVTGDLTVKVDWQKSNDVITNGSLNYLDYKLLNGSSPSSISGTISLTSEIDNTNKQIKLANDTLYYGLHILDNGNRVAYYAGEEFYGTILYDLLGNENYANILYDNGIPDHNVFVEDKDVPFSYANEYGYTQYKNLISFSEEGWIHPGGAGIGRREFHGFAKEDGVLDPFGKSNACKFTENNTDNNPRLSASNDRPNLKEGEVYTFSVWAKTDNAFSGTAINLGISGGGNSSTYASKVITDQWERIYITATMSSNDDRCGTVGGWTSITRNSGFVLYLAYPQFVVGADVLDFESTGKQVELKTTSANFPVNLLNQGLDVFNYPLKNQGRVKEVLKVVDNHCLVGDSSWYMEVDYQPTSILIDGEDVLSSCVISDIGGGNYKIVFPDELKIYNLIINDIHYPVSEGINDTVSGIDSSQNERIAKLVNFEESYWGKQDNYAYNFTEGGWLAELSPDDTQAFKTVWDTTESGVSQGDQIQLPITLIQDEILVDWGDDTIEYISSTGNSELTHTYASAGLKSIRIWGEYQFQFSNGGDKIKLKSIEQWGKFTIGENAFRGCTELQINATDTPTLFENLTAAFYGVLITSIPNINTWDTSKVTTIDELFMNCSKFNNNLSGWDTSLVDSALNVFRGATDFNNGDVAGASDQPLSWSLPNAQTVSSFFEGCSSFNQSLPNFGLEKCTDMSSMFKGCTVFDQDISHFTTSQVTVLDSIFYGARDFNNGSKPLLWDTGKVSSYIYAFRDAEKFNQDISSWSVKSGVYFSGMFYGAATYNNGGVPLSWSDIGENIVESVISMGSMFRDARAFNQPIDNWNVSKVYNFSNAFRGATAFNQPIGTWDMRNVSNISYMFNDAMEFDQSIGGWTFTRLEKINSAFSGASSFNQELNNWNVSTVENMYGTFANASKFNKSLNNWDLSKTTNTSYMFSGATNFNGELDGWAGTTALVEDMSLMFNGASSFNQPLNSWNTSSVNNMLAMFNGATSFNQPLDGWDVSQVVTMKRMFKGTGIDQNLNSWNTSKVVSMEEMFEDATSFNNGSGTINLTWNVSSVKSMKEMFSKAEAFNKKLDTWDVGSVTDFEGMFFQALVFNQNLSSWNLASATTIKSMFKNATVFNNGGALADNTNPLKWNIGSITDCSGCFSYTDSFNQELFADNGVDAWDTSNVVSTEEMFKNALVFNKDISSWNTSVATTMRNMFSGAAVFNQNLSSWNVASVTDMYGMFNGAKDFNNGETSNLSSSPLTWNTSQVTTMQAMFKSSDFNQELKDAAGTGTMDTTSVIDMANMFENCSLFNQDISGFDVQNVTDFGTDFMTVNVPFSTSNYDLLLNTWSALPSLNSNLTISFGDTQYSSPGNGRNTLTGTYSWTINDGGAV